MGFRSAWVLVPATACLGFIISCATQASDSPGNGSSAGDTSSVGGASSNGGSAGASVTAGQSGGGLSGAVGGASGTSGASGAGTAGNVGAAGGAGASGASSAGAGGSAGAAAGGSAGAGTSGSGGASSGAGGVSGSAGVAAGGATNAGTGGSAGAAAGGAASGGAASGGAAGTSGSAGSAGSAGSGGAGGSGGIVGKMYVLNQFVIGSSAASATVQVTWNASQIEFVFVVQDATPEDDSPDNWNDDAVEIYLDLNNGKTTTFQPDDCEIVIPRLTGAVNGVGTVSYANIVVNKTPGATSYTVDAKVPWSALNITTPPLGQNIGINLAVDDDTNGGDRDAQLMLFGDQFAYNNPSTWGTLLLN
jgi:hypothetical protein